MSDPTPYIQAEPISEGVRTGLAAIARENVHVNHRESDKEAWDRALQAQRRSSGKPDPKRSRKTLL